MNDREVQNQVQRSFKNQKKTEFPTTTGMKYFTSDKEKYAFETTQLILTARLKIHQHKSHPQSVKCPNVNSKKG